MDVLLVAQGGNITASHQNNGTIKFVAGLVNGTGIITVTVNVQQDIGNVQQDTDLHFADTSGLLSVSGTSIGGSSLTISGSLDAINNALQSGLILTRSQAAAVRSTAEPSRRMEFNILRKR